MNKTHHCTCLKSVFVGLGQRLADVAHKSRPLRNSAFYILYPNKMTLLNKISVFKDVIQIVCWNPEGGSPLYGLYGDVPLDSVWFSSSLSLTGYIISHESVLNRVHNFAQVCPKQCA